MLFVSLDFVDLGLVSLTWVLVFCCMWRVVLNYGFLA